MAAVEKAGGKVTITAPKAAKPTEAKPKKEKAAKEDRAEGKGDDDNGAAG